MLPDQPNMYILCEKAKTKRAEALVGVSNTRSCVVVMVLCVFQVSINVHGVLASQGKSSASLNAGPANSFAFADSRFTSDTDVVLVLGTKTCETAIFLTYVDYAYEGRDFHIPVLYERDKQMIVEIPIQSTMVTVTKCSVRKAYVDNLNGVPAMLLNDALQPFFPKNPSSVLHYYVARVIEPEAGRNEGIRVDLLFDKHMCEWVYMPMEKARPCTDLEKMLVKRYPAMKHDYKVLVSFAPEGRSTVEVTVNTGIMSGDSSKMDPDRRHNIPAIGHEPQDVAGQKFFQLPKFSSSNFFFGPGDRNLMVPVNNYTPCLIDT
eukprot:GHVQ01018176.1.p1 GENE.GHVQ01018176.1~~GHVQ01018176.1.p1  ORF type:complete len:319 (+),score=32.23 GHVQ01018176.1:542-1498(+)